MTLLNILLNNIDSFHIISHEKFKTLPPKGQQFLAPLGVSMEHSTELLMGQSNPTAVEQVTMLV